MIAVRSVPVDTALERRARTAEWAFPLSQSVETARALIRLVPAVPTPVWGRDELAAGEMWNSNSVIGWLLEQGGLATDPISPPTGGRAPGWHAGVVVARRTRSRNQPDH